MQKAHISVQNRHWQWCGLCGDDYYLILGKAEGMSLGIDYFSNLSFGVEGNDIENDQKGEEASND